MSDPDTEDRASSATDSPRPFEAAPRELPAPRQGCSRMAMAGCAAALLLVGLAVLALMLKASDVVSWSLGQVRTEIVRTLPADLPAADRQRLERAFDAVSEQLDRGELDALAFQDLQKQMMFFARLGRPPTREEVAALAAALERFAGIEPPPDSDSGTPAASRPESTA